MNKGIAQIIIKTEESLKTFKNLINNKSIQLELREPQCNTFRFSIYPAIGDKGFCTYARNTNAKSSCSRIIIIMAFVFGWDC